MVPKLVAPSYDNVEIDPHLFDDDILESLNEEEEPPMDYSEFKKTVDKMSSSVQGSGLKSAQKPTMSCTATTEDVHPPSTEDDGSWLLEQIDQMLKLLGKIFILKPKNFSKSTTLPLAKMT